LPILHSDIIVSIIRITYVVEVNFEDVTYGDYQAQIWTVVEVSVAIIIACLPLCRVAFEHILSLSIMSTGRKHPHSASWTNLEAQGQHDQQPLKRGDEPAGTRNPFDEELDAIELQTPSRPAEKHARGTSDGHGVARNDQAQLGFSKDVLSLYNQGVPSGAKSL